MRILIVDDEPLARQRLRGLVEALAGGDGGLQVDGVAEAGDADAAVAALQAEPADLVLLDIQLQALDYLTKPVRRERLQAALQRAAQQLALVRGVQPPVVPEPVLVLSERGRVLRLPVREALVLKAEQKYVTLRTAQQTFVLDDSLSDLERRLGPGFVRVHRNALVAVAAIRELQPHALGDEGDGWRVSLTTLMNERTSIGAGTSGGGPRRGSGPIGEAVKLWANMAAGRTGGGGAGGFMSTHPSDAQRIEALRAHIMMRGYA